MSFALIKLSFNRIGENNVEGGICGTGFFVDNNRFITANHIFSSINNRPNNGFANCQYWLASRTGQVIEIKNVNIHDHPEIDTTEIIFNRNVTENVVELNRERPNVNDEISNHGYLPNMPEIDATWGQNGLIIRSTNLNMVHSDTNGFIRNIQNVTIRANDVNITNKTLIITSYPGRIGMSGGPMLNDRNQVIGLMSIGLPADVAQKEFLGAIWINEIMNTIGQY